MHRGNWGLKRPLPFRTRNAHATVAAVDSREQQTEWASAESQSRWIRMWDEVAITPKVSEGGPWDEKLGPDSDIKWPIDSEFGGDREREFGEQLKEVARQKEIVKAKEAGLEVEMEVVDPLVEEAKSLGVFAPEVPTENVHAMTDREFESYLRRLRELRPKFRRYLELDHAMTTPQKPRKSIWEQSQAPASTAHKKFLSAQMQSKYDSPDVHAIEQQPHKAGGLLYARNPDLQAFLLNKPRPGRIIRTRTTVVRGPAGYTVSYAGQNAIMNSAFLGRDQVPMDWTTLAKLGTRDPQQGVGRFKLIGARLVDGPSVVGPKPSGLMSAVVTTEVRGWDEQGDLRPNPHWPGSREYVGMSEVVPTSNIGVLKPAPPPPTTTPSQRIHSKEVISTLHQIIEKSKMLKGEPGSSVP